MPSTAISAQGSTISVAGTPGTSISITGITKAAAAVVTATNTVAVGDVVLFGVVTGMPEINGLFGKVTVASGTTFTVAINSSNFASVGTTGAAVPQTWVKVGNFHDYTGFDGSATEIDRTNLDSLAMENFPGLQDFGTFSFNVDNDDTDVGQLALKANKTSATIAPFKLVLPNGKYRVWQGWVKKFSEAGGVNALLKCSVDVRITGYVYFA